MGEEMWEADKMADGDEGNRREAEVGAGTTVVITNPQIAVLEIPTALNYTLRNFGSDKNYPELSREQPPGPDSGNLHNGFLIEARRRYGSIDLCINSYNSYD